MPAVSAPKRLRQIMIAIIDDDVAVREATSNLLDSLGYSTAKFGSAEEFLQSNRRHEARCVPIILITAFPEDGMRDRALSAGAIGFLIKPFTQESLISTVAAVLQA
jgi:FixJ family two-component response regulator